MSDDRSPDEAGNASPREQGRQAKPDSVGRALRSVYDDTLREDIPDEFKDLLGKLQ
ncbi:NepR family anti-sigma factor [Sphingomicrobium flavum]|uniref:NepR family anti-sigma factor n=1 Tax=Sphingomicrobium flavum TaxID=1229164 RepID=UPI0021ADD090|nr:NepR family anti-sigma factor [Sphingomicrobium flavum]